MAKSAWWPALTPITDGPAGPFPDLLSRAVMPEMWMPGTELYTTGTVLSVKPEGGVTSGTVVIHSNHISGALLRYTGNPVCQASFDIPSPTFFLPGQAHGYPLPEVPISV